MSQGPESQRYQRGEVIASKYELIRRLDEGGMGTVWVARNVDLDAHVALKLIKSDNPSPEMNQRFLNEARMVARLGHPAIVRVYDFGKSQQGDPYIVMELLDGECLADALHHGGGRFGGAQAVQTMLPIIDALAVAHERGVVHRDLKPENIYLAKVGTSRTQPKVLDFGIARTDGQVDQRLTQTGTLLGSPGYMCPEQARGETELDRRVDIWGVAVMLYELVTGRAPFDGENYNAILRSIIEDTPEPITSFASGDPELWSIIEKGLAKNPDERWRDMRTMGTALARWIYNQGIFEDVTHASLESTWLLAKHVDLEAHADPQAPSSFPPVALRRSSAPPSSRSSLVETQDAPLVPRVSTGGHGALAVTSNRSAAPRTLKLVAALAVAATVAVAVGMAAYSSSGGDSPSSAPASGGGLNPSSLETLTPNPPKSSPAPPEPAKRDTESDAGKRTELDVVDPMAEDSKKLEGPVDGDAARTAKPSTPPREKTSVPKKPVTRKKPAPKRQKRAQPAGQRFRPSGL